MTKSKYSEEQITFILENAWKGSVYILTELEKQYGIKISNDTVRRICSRNNVKLKAYRKGYNYYVIDCIEKSYNAGLTFKEISQELENRFKLRVSYESVKSYIKIRMPNLKGYRQMHIVHKPIGSEITTKNGDIYVKVHDYKTTKDHKEFTTNWKPKKYVVWESVNGPVPEGYVLIHANGDKTNNDISNIRCVSKFTATKLIKRWNDNALIMDAFIEIFETEKILKELI